MRRLLIALVATIAVGVIWVGAASADGGYHGSYNTGGAGATTNRCAGCHRTHTGSGDGLIKATTIYGLCTSCHDATGSSDVVHGIRTSTGAGLKGGGFATALMNTTLAATGPTVPATSTSAHSVNGMPGYPGAQTVWGIGALGGSIATGPTPAGTTTVLECTSCHDPHGGSGGIDPVTKARIPTYRILRSDIASKVTGAGPNVVVAEDTATTKTKYVSSATSVYYGQSYSNIDMTQLNNWCATCHTRIHTSDMSSPPGSTSSNDPIYNFRHATTGTSVEINLGTTVLRPAGSPGCVTCHVSHGSSAVMDGAAASVPQPAAPGVSSPNLDSSLLRVNNRGVCELCHNK